MLEQEFGRGEHATAANRTQTIIIRSNFAQR